MNHDAIMVSVCCMTYNHAPYIRKTLEGFLSQRTSFPMEILIHDDASTDETAQIIREYAQRYPDLIRPVLQTENQHSRGVYITRDILLPMARGKYIAHCEGDDYWTDPDKLQKQVDFLEGNPSYSASMHNCSFVDENNNPIESIYPMYRYYTSHSYTLRRFACDVVYPGQTATLVHRKDAFCHFQSPEQEKAFYSMRVTTGDKRMYLKLLLAGDIYCFEDVMSAYRIVTSKGDSWSARNRGKNLSYLLHVAAIDFRGYAQKYNKKPFPNYYSTFHTGVAGILKYLLRPDSQNRQVCAAIIREHHGILGTGVYLAGQGILAIPGFFVRNVERKKYDPKD